MGWLFLNPHPLTPKQYLDAQFSYDPNHDRGRSQSLRILKSALRGTTYYAACELKDADKPAAVTAVICNVKINPTARDGLTFGYKDMTENMGPYNYDCPASVLDLLTPTDNAYANEWRSKCRANLALTSRPRPKPGDTIIMPEPMTFTDGIGDRVFTVTPHRKGIALRRKTDNQLVTIARLMSRPWKIIPAISVSR